MADVFLTKRIEFAAAHRYENPAWEPEHNRTVFGACYNDPGHGHNYLLEVTVAGEVDEATGMVVNLYDLKRMLEEVLEEFDHKHLNLDTPYFRETIPTTENIVHVLWRILAGRSGLGRLETVRLYEDEDLFAEVTSSLAAASDGNMPKARLKRRYHFSAAHRLYTDRLSIEANRAAFGSCAGATAHGHNYVLEVMALGSIARDTGMVVPLSLVDDLVKREVLTRFDRKDLNRDAAFTEGHLPSGENVVRVIWNLLVKHLQTHLERIRLVESRETAFEYTGERSAERSGGANEQADGR
jgi:6-pyruvoyltetrahydropterin/6-carboxytetrahydropterin synthase